MRGSIRRRGKASFEYIVDIGSAAAQRCQVCKRRFWIERKPRESCPKCGGELFEAEERRRAIKGGYATRKECQAALNKVLSTVEARTYAPPSKITVTAFLLNEWLPTIKGSLRPTTYASYGMLAREHVIPRLGSLQLQKLTPASINALYAHLSEHGRVHGGGPLSASSVRRVHAVLHRACHDAVRWGRLTTNPVAAADPPKASAEHRDRLPVWSAEQLDWDPGAADGQRPCFHIDVVPGQAKRLSPAHAGHGQQSPKGKEAIVSNVGKEGRTIALDPVTLEALRAHAARQADEQSCWAEGYAESGFVFTRRDGQPLQPWVVSGVNPRIVSGRLGHSTVALTLDVYSHVLPQQDRQAAETIAALLL